MGKKKHKKHGKSKKDTAKGLVKQAKDVRQLIESESKAGGVLYTYFNFLVDIGIVQDLKDAFTVSPGNDTIDIISARHNIDIALFMSAAEEPENENHHTLMTAISNSLYSSLKIPAKIHDRDILVGNLVKLSNELGLTLDFADNHMKFIQDDKKYPIGIYFVNEFSDLGFREMANVVIQDPSSNNTLVVSEIIEFDDDVAIFTNYSTVLDEQLDGKINDESTDFTSIIKRVMLDIVAGKGVQTK